MKVIGYVRISSQNKEQQEVSHAEQDREIRAWCRARRVQLVGMAVDRGVSGTTEYLKRPGLAEALNRIKAGQAGALVVRELDRLSREMMIQEAIFAEVWAISPTTAIVSTKDTEAQNCGRNDPAEPSRQFVREIMGATAGFIRRLTIARMTAGKDAKRRKGGFVGGQVTYGKRSVDAKLVPDPVEQAGIKRIRELAAAGLSSHRIAVTLNAEGITAKRGGEWHSTTVLRILERAS